LHQLALRVVELLDKTAGSAAPPLAPFDFITLPIATTAARQLQCARDWVTRQRQITLAREPNVSRNRSMDAKRKITVGYVSADFWSHPTAFLTAELFERHDRDRFAVFGYSHGPDDGSPMRRRLVNAFDRFVDLKGVSCLDAARRIFADGVDILVDLKGHTQNGRPRIFAARPAPIQVNYLAYPGTTGAPCMDYILVDDFIVPPDQQRFFTERLVHLPGCYQVNDSRREIAPRVPSRAECGLPADGFVFCCFNNSYKITPEVFEVWMNLLKAVPGSVLWLLAGNRFAPANLRREAAARGVAEDRLVFAPRQPLAEHLARHRLADLFLDCFPVNAHTTASDALWAGCPMVTLAGETFVSRVAGSLLRAVGLAELITTSLEDYEAMALRLARDADMLANVRARLAENRKTSGLFDARQFVRNLERAYVRMWEVHACGEQPRPFAIDCP
jgi:predicted O-linked N-acetylglucosamine transferase (SPINDLY family)